MISVSERSVYTPLNSVSEGNILSSTWMLMQGRLWELVEGILCAENNEYKKSAAFDVIPFGKIVVSTDPKQDDEILKYARYSSRDGVQINGGHGWNTFARICFGWNNLIMAEEGKHTELKRVFRPLFETQAVREGYFKELKMVTQDTVNAWAQEKEGVNLLNAALEHSCRSVTTCFLGREAAKSTEIVEAVQNLMKVFWDNAQIKPLSVIYQIGRTILGSCYYCDPEGFDHSHDVLNLAIQEACKSPPKDSFMSCLLNGNFTFDELIDNMKMLYFAGTETTGSAVSSAVAFLSLHKDEQEKLREELRELNIFSMEDLDYDKLHQLSRLQLVIYEALRLAPPLPMQVRRVTTDLGSYSYFMDHYHRLRDVSRVGSKPEEFDPDRFLRDPSLKKEVERTFGGGRTPCIGKNFALTETLLLVASIILQGSIELTNGNPFEIIKEAGAHIAPELKIRIHKKPD